MSAAVGHPRLIARPAEIETARRNIERHAWARRLLDELVAEARALPETTAAYLARMIPRETPGSHLFTMCPSCEGAPVHGSYRWSPDDPDRLICTVCGTTYPNDAYPETYAIETGFGGGQRITFYAGKSWQLIGFPFVSSWTANIRARKCDHMARTARRLGLAFALTGDPAWARRARDILLRFAAIYPGYMVHSGYGEFSDLDAATASRRIMDLPRPELVVPPNRPDGKLHVGYWMAGRATGVGMEGTFVADVAVAYDLTCEAVDRGRSVYSDGDRLLVERDLLREGTILLLADRAFNNKSATNRSAVGMVGVCLGDPALVRFGLEGFHHFVREWFLPDGMSSESPAYGFMTLEGIRGFGEALHGYSDPPGYQGPDGRIDDLDVYGDSRYRAALEGFVHGLMPDLSYGSPADDYPDTRMPLEVADILACRYDTPAHRALLAELRAGHPQAGGEYALFHRDPLVAGSAVRRESAGDPLVAGSAVRRESAGDPLVAGSAARRESAGDRLTLDDRFFPALRIGLLRAGDDGRGATALLSASDWGIHHHEDSLNLVYWKDGHEALTDLGYLWDRPDKHMTVRTIAHNTVVVDGADQRRQGRGGDLYAFDAAGWVKLVDAGSQAYEQASLYRRACLLVDHGGGRGYLLDLFRVRGGRTHDYLFHGPRERGRSAGPALRPRPQGWHDLTDAGDAAAAEPWSMVFDLDDRVRFAVHALPEEGETAIVGDGWGERGSTSRERGARAMKVPYVVRRREGDPADSAFATVFDVSPASAPFVREVARIEPRSGSGLAVLVRTPASTDLVALCWDGGRAAFDTPVGRLELHGAAAAFSLSEGGRLEHGWLYAGPEARLAAHRIALSRPLVGGAVAGMLTTNEESSYLLDGDALGADDVGRTLLVAGAYRTGYRILRVDREGARSRAYTKVAGAGYDALPAERWTVAASVRV